MTFAPRYLALALLVLALGGCRAEIVHDLDEPQANQILDVLNRRAIGARKSRVTRGSAATYTVSVARGDAPRAWRVLREHNLPRPKTKGVGELFGNVGLVPTATQERALMHQALAGELSRTLQRVDGVRDARVHVVLPEKKPFASGDSKAPEPRASVLLKVGKHAPLTAGEVKRLVAGAVDGLDEKRVSVVIVKAPAAAGGKQHEAPRLASVGPFDVAPGSRGPLLATLIALLVLLGAMVVLALLALRRARRARDEAASAAAAAPGAGRTDPRGTSGAGFSVDLDSSLSLVSRAVGRPTVGGATRSRHER
ncbi:MAG: secretion protein [Myxococcales bacterium]|nr:secretion protein [Myxococcales bacterium]